ncbi:ABC transporter permease [Georgenia deserti]|uniref:ABC transporter permease n=1 Tax=Georgenia deserti TaxID=2093781 RepID=A0ABW4L0R8_9MICO
MTTGSSTYGFEIPTASRPGAAAWGQMILAEARSVIRDTAGLVVPIGLPAVLLLSQAFGTSQESVAEAGDRSVLEVFILPITLVMVVAMVGVVNMPSFLATYRKLGLLKRLAATPAHPAMVLVAQVTVSVVQTVVGLGLALGIVGVGFGLVGPEDAPATLGTLMLVAAAMYATGMLIGALAPTTNASIALGLLAFLVMGAAGGMFGGTQNLPESMARFGEWLPFGAGLRLLEAAWLGGEIEARHVIALSAAVVLGVASAVRFFRWSR